MTGADGQVGYSIYIHMFTGIFRYDINTQMLNRCNSLPQV